MSDKQDITRDNREDYRPDTVLSHEFDGIQEFDNRLPNWWMWIMYGTIIFSVFYWIVFHTLELRQLPREQFAEVMAKAEEEQLARMAAAGIDNDFFVALAKNDAKVASGREIFTKHCVACHLDQGQGFVGPNLTDGVWIHGCDPMSIQKTVNEGVAAKGMPAWLNQLGPSRVMDVVAYVMTFRGTNVAGKAPEGEPCEF